MVNKDWLPPASRTKGRAVLKTSSDARHGSCSVHNSEAQKSWPNISPSWGLMSLRKSGLWGPARLISPKNQILGGTPSSGWEHPLSDVPWLGFA